MSSKTPSRASSPSTTMSQLSLRPSINSRRRLSVQSQAHSDHILTTVMACLQVESAKQAATKVDSELSALQATLKDIEDARPVEDLTTADVAKARPAIITTAEEMVKHGKWSVPGYEQVRP